MAAWYSRALACPDCSRPVGLEEDAVRCLCGFAAPDGRPFDLRPQHPAPRSLVVALGAVADPAFEGIDLSRPAAAYEGPSALRDSRELFSAAMPRLPRGGRILDLGCGPRDQAVPAAHLGLEYAGVDYSSAAADLLADAHSIPFRDGTFDAVLSYAVFEHLYAPALALREVARVLKPGGVFFGTVSQGEPFHDSYFHHTAWGVSASFRAAGLRVLRLWPSYDTLHALAVMGRYAKLIRPLIELVNRVDRALPFLAPRKYFRASRREKELDDLHRAASICFLAVVE